jgi:hypothetical protein
LVKEQQTTVAAIVVIVLLSDFWSTSVLDIHLYIATKTSFPSPSKTHFLLNATNVSASFARQELKQHAMQKHK